MSNLFRTPDTPDVPEPAPIPDEETESRARRRRIASLRRRSGRQSTALSPRDTGRGTEFSRTLLG